MEGLANDQLSGLRQRLDGLVLAKVLSLAVGSGVVSRNDILKSKTVLVLHTQAMKVCLCVDWSLTSAEVLFVPSFRWFRSR